MAKAGKAKGGPGRGRQPKGAQGKEGKYPIPRSMGQTFEYIRRGMYAEEGLDEFGRRLQAVECPFAEDPRAKAESGSPRSRISGYERAQRHIYFGTQHRYGTLSKTHTGVIHLISLFYAFLRCAANDKENTAAFRAKQLQDAAAVARKLEALAACAAQMVATAKSSGLLDRLKDDAWEDSAKRLEHELAVMKRLFDAFREG